MFKKPQIPDKLLRFSEGAELWLLDDDGAKAQMSSANNEATRFFAAVLPPVCRSTWNGKLDSGTVRACLTLSDGSHSNGSSHRHDPKQLLMRRRSLFDPDNETAANMTKARDFGFLTFPFCLYLQPDLGLSFRTCTCLTLQPASGT